MAAGMYALPAIPQVIERWPVGKNVCCRRRHHRTRTPARWVARQAYKRLSVA